MDYRFGKNEKLKRKKHIAALFAEGHAVTKFPVKMIYLPVEASVNKAAFSVPKKKVRKATDRNRIKRLLRETYRLHKNELHTQEQKFVFMFIFLDREEPDFKKITVVMKHLLTTLKGLYP